MLVGPCPWSAVHGGPCGSLLKHVGPWDCLLMQVQGWDSLYKQVSGVPGFVSGKNPAGISVGHSDHIVPQPFYALDVLDFV